MPFRNHPFKECRTARYAVIAAFNLALAATRSAQALTITPNFDSSITSNPNAAAIESGINSAIATYETMFLNPINVSITFQSVSTGLGESSTFILNDTYTDFLSKLTASQTSASDATALAHLQMGPNNPVNGSPNMTLSTANAKALGVFTGNSTIGATMSLNTSIMYYSHSAVDPTKYDMFGVVSHEMDEILGLGSALVNGSNNSAAPTGAIRPEDLFRYDQTGARSFSTGDDTATQAYFSLDGTTQIARFNQTSGTTTGGDFGDWYSYNVSHTPQVQDAYGTPGINLNLGVSEKTALDAIGYTLLTTLTWNPTGSTSGTPPDGTGTWIAASGSNWWNGSSNSVWSNGTVQNAQFGTAGTASAAAYTVTLGSAITVGTLTFGNQNYTLNGGGHSLTINSGILDVSSATVNAAVILGGTSSWETVGTATLIVAGNVSGGFGITKQGPGMLVLSGSNSYSGGTTVNSGTLQLQSASALPASGNVIVSAGSIDINGQTPTIGNLTFGDGVSALAASVIDSAATKGSITLTGDITYVGTQTGVNFYFPATTVPANLQLASGTHHVTTADSGSVNTFDVILSGTLTGPGGLTKDGSNNVALTGASSYAGATAINNGELVTGAMDTLSMSSAFTVNSPGVLLLNPSSTQSGVTTGAYSQAIGSLSGAGSVQLGAATLATGSDGTTTTFSGTISGTNGSLTKTGAGTLILTGNNGYTGITTINAGALQLGNGLGNGFINSSSGITGLAGATLIFDYNVNPGFSVPISGAIGVTQAGTGVMFLYSNNTYSGTTTISSGGIYVGNGTAGTLGTGNVVNNGTLLFERTDLLVVPNAISGSGVLYQNASGGIALTGANTYTGATYIYIGTLQLGNGGTSGSLASATPIGGNSGTTLAFNRTDNFTVGNAISGGLTVAQNGTGAVTLSAASGYSGPTQVNAGTLLVSGSITGSATTVNAGGTLGGTGSVGVVNAVAGGSVSPGSAASPGLLSSGNFSLASGAHLSLELNGVSGTGTSAIQYSELSVAGSVTLGGDAQITLFASYVPAVNDTFFIILNNNSDGIIGTFSNAVSNVITSGGIQYLVNYAANGDGGTIGNDVSLKVLAIPEPDAWTSMFSGLALVFGCKRFRRA